MAITGVFNEYIAIKYIAKKYMKKISKSAELPEVNFSDYGDIRTLHLSTEWIQGSMIIDSPFEIELEYVQRMMAWLLFVDAASVSKRHAMQLGLGAATCTKFCFKKLRMQTTAVEKIGRAHV